MAQNPSATPNQRKRKGVQPVKVLVLVLAVRHQVLQGARVWEKVSAESELLKATFAQIQKAVEQTRVSILSTMTLRAWRSTVVSALLLS
jgi:hypothetical protein